jgi:soluble lytic murein transglycosylase-like protein
MRSRSVFAVCLLCAALPARADIYGFVDDEGEVHLANHPTSERYEAWAVAPQAEAPAVKTEAAAEAPRNAALTELRSRYDALVREAAGAVELEPALVHAVVSVESRYNPRAVSRKGASGLMQLMPETARRYGVADVFDPAQNLRAGARYLRDLLRMFDNDLKLALAAYNAGENAVARHGRIPPYRETLAYVPKVLAFYRQLGARAG